MPMLDGPRVNPRGTPQSLVVLLHGFGANGDDLIPLAREWQPHMPSAAFVSPNAPQQIPEYAGGLQWFPLAFRDPDAYWRGVNAAAPALDAFIDAELARLGLGAERLALVGFSQGCMMALHTGLRRSVAPAAIVGLSGRIIGEEHLQQEARCSPPILLMHGEADDLIPVEAMHHTREALAQAGFAVEWHVRPGLGHGIDMETIAVSGDFLARHLPG
jgi:phospholipase/carboxylesterase